MTHLISEKLEPHTNHPELGELVTHAVAVAREAEYVAADAANKAQCFASAAYPPWVTLLNATFPHPNPSAYLSESDQPPF